MSEKYIGISEDRLHHLLGVARLAYQIALNRGHDEKFARKMFLLGWVHDIGYEFSEKNEQHPDIGVDMILSIIPYIALEDFIHSETYQALRKHGKYIVSDMTEEWLIITQADLQVNYKGQTVDVTKRLQDIANRYGEYSDEYLTACDVAYRCGLTAVNLASLK